MTNTSTPIVSSHLDMHGQRRAYVCPVCRREAFLLPGKHWCTCLSKTPTRMTESTVDRQVSEKVKEMTRSFTKAVDQARGKKP